MDSVDLKKYDHYYKGMVIEGICKDGWTLFSEVCKSHVHFFELIEAAFATVGVVEVKTYFSRDEVAQ